MKSLNYKFITRSTYNNIAPDYAKRDKSNLTEERPEVQRDLQKFISLLPKKANVLDLGCGSGRDSRFLAKNGLRVIGVDFSEKMIEQAKYLDRQINYLVLDFESMRFQDGQFDGIWANASLHHIPYARLRRLLKDIYRILKPRGIFFVKVKQGVYRGIRSNEKFGKIIKRYFRFYRLEEIESLLKSAGFRIIFKKTTNNDEWVDIFCKT